MSYVMIPVSDLGAKNPDDEVKLKRILVQIDEGEYIATLPDSGNLELEVETYLGRLSIRVTGQGVEIEAL